MVNNFEVNAIKTPARNQGKLGNIIHDLENPLTLTQFNLDQVYLKASSYQDGELTQLLEPAMSGVKEMSIMINSIKMKNDYMPYSINHQISDILNIFTNRCKQNDIILKYIPSVDKVLYHHKVEFRSIVSNLIANAVEASLQSDKIVNYVSVSTSVEGDHIRLIIRDNADGLPMDIQNDIKRKVLTSNKGLGLVYSNVANGFNGSIKLTSIKNHGTEFDILLS